MGAALGIAIATFIHIFDLEAVVLGGGVIEAWDAFKEAMFEEVRRRSFVQRADPRRILKSGLGNRAGIYGAACLALQN
jgi:glucokinase